jgi:hypothetical protein
MAMTPVAYLTDVEGLWSRLQSFAHDNPLVRLETEGGAQRLVVAPGACFVFGGDAVDRGPQGRLVVSTLVEAKLRQPEQVILLAGNRDLNKLRLRRELAGTPPPRTPADVAGGPRPALLRWILANTMGADAAFGHRQDELGRERGGAVDDETVVDSFLADVEPGGALLAYLRLATVAVRIGSALFVHGGLGRQSLGAVPGAPPPTDPRAVDVDAWLARLNHWYREQIAAYDAEAFEPGGRPAWAPLIAYQAPHPGQRTNPESVVYGRLADAHNNLHLPDRDVIAALGQAGVRRVFVGHTPSGDSPALLTDPERDFALLCADNSHARHGLGSQVEVSDAEIRVNAHVCLDGGPRPGPPASPKPVRLDVAAAGARGPLGLRTVSGARLVKGVLGDGRLLLYRALAGWSIEQTAHDLAHLGELEPPT